jgi:hypothetical protein
MSQSQAWLMLTAGNLPTYDNARVPGLKSFGAMSAEDVKHALGGLPSAPFRFGMVAFLGDLQSLSPLERHVEDEVDRMAERGRWRIDKNHSAVVLLMARLMLWEIISAQSAREVYAHDEHRQTRGEPPVLCPVCLGKGRVWGTTAAAERLQELRDRLEQLRLDRERAWCEKTLEGSTARKIPDRSEFRELGLAIQVTEGQVARGARCDTCEGTGSFVLTEAKRAAACGVSERQWREHWSERYSGGVWYVRRLEHWAVGHVAARLRRDE